MLKPACTAAVTLAACAIAGTVSPSPSQAAPGMLVGIYDGVQPVAAPETTFPTLVDLHVRIIRLDLRWNEIARMQPANPTDPADPAYDWNGFDETVMNAAKNNIRVLFTIYGTPAWAQGKAKGTNRAPHKMSSLRYFATAAATRYSGTFERDDGTTLPAVRRWLAWNEPNNPLFLQPQWARVGKSRFYPVGARTYVGICTAIWSGIHATRLPGETVACGATAPRGNNSGKNVRPSISPMAFLKDLKHYGLRGTRFDVYAHHPYYQRPAETPATKPKDRNSVTLGNIGDLTKLLGKLYGNKKLWITEYGYQTSPPDKLFGVSWAKQARYLTQAYAIARKNPRITMMLWFLLRDETRLSGWQSGLFTATGKKKPAYDAFRRLPH
jgi:hypothetical protein